MASLKADHPSVKKVLDALDRVGLKYSVIMGSAVIIEGGVDAVKACGVKAFAEKVTDSEGFIGRDTVQRGMRDGRRALLAHVAETLVNERGAELVKKELLHHTGPHIAIDESYEMRIDGTNVTLALMLR